MLDTLGFPWTATITAFGSVIVVSHVKLMPHQHNDSRHDETRCLVMGHCGGAAAPMTTIPCIKSHCRPVMITEYVPS